MAKVGDTLGGRYLVTATVRETRSTVTLRAIDLRIGCEVDVEVVRAGIGPRTRSAQRLELDAQLASELAHPIVLPPRDLGVEDDGAPYVVTARPKGETLDDRVCLSGVLGRDDVIRIGLDLLAAIASAHDKGIVHGSLGPEHVYLVERDSVLLGVFLSGFGGGMARGDEDAPLGFSRMAFVPPERLESGKVDEASDLYALAGILWFALTGRSPRTARSEGPLAQSTHPPHVRVLRKALRTEPTRRYGSAREMIHALLVARDAPAVATTATRRSYPSLTGVVSGITSGENTPTRNDPALLERVLARRDSTPTQQDITAH